QHGGAIEPIPGAGNPLHSLVKRGALLAQSCQYRGRLPDKNTTIPVILAGNHKLLGHVRSGFFAEAPDAANADALALSDFWAAMNVTVTRGRKIRGNAKGNESGRVLVSNESGNLDGAAELLGRLDDVIGRGDHHDGGGIAGDNEGGAEADARSRV